MKENVHRGERTMINVAKPVQATEADSRAATIQLDAAISSADSAEVKGLAPGEGKSVGNQRTRAPAARGKGGRRLERLEARARKDQLEELYREIKCAVEHVVDCRIGIRRAFHDHMVALIALHGKAMFMEAIEGLCPPAEPDEGYYADRWDHIFEGYHRWLRSRSPSERERRRSPKAQQGQPSQGAAT
jgi:hypothetical protein